jgi:hypothetical protein
MKKKVLNEIDRYRELMGLEQINESQKNKILITEGTYQNGEIPDSVLTNVNDSNGNESNVKLSLIAAPNYNEMVEAAKADGIALNSSQGYRPCGSEERGCKDGFTQWCAWFKWNKNPKYAARPCTSNHGWGCAVDVKNCKGGSKVHKWLKENASKFGFKPYYAESWHWEHQACIDAMKKGVTPDADESIDTEDSRISNVDKDAENDTTSTSSNDTSATDVDTTSPWDVEGAIKSRMEKAGSKINDYIKKLTDFS